MSWPDAKPDYKWLSSNCVFVDFSLEGEEKEDRKEIILDLVWILERAIAYREHMSIFPNKTLDPLTWDLELQEKSEDMDLPLMLESGLKRK